MGTVAILTRAAQRTDRSECIQLAQELFDHHLAWPMEGNGVEEAGLCHGACAVVHIVSRFYQSDVDPGRKDAARKWLETAMGCGNRARELEACRIDKAECVGERQKSRLQVPEWFHWGCIGAAAALTPVEPQWDGCRYITESEHGNDMPGHTFESDVFAQ